MDLAKRFEAAGLKLEESGQPLVRGLRGGGDIVQIDIGRKTKGNLRQEWFRIYRGSEENRLEVVGIDKSIGQLVLMVHEPVREFEEQVPFNVINRYRTDHGDLWIEEFCKAQGLRRRDIVVRGTYQVAIKRKTEGRKRHFLLGIDERQLFIAQLPKSVSTVREAHACLKAPTVTLAEGKQRGRTVRQGEWFFIHPTEEEAARIAEGIKKKIVTIEKSVPIGPFHEGTIRGPKVRQFRGNPHTVDELIVLPGSPVTGGRFAVRAREIFVRGKVRHVDHATVSFSSWRKTIRNTEPNQGQASGVGWVD